MANRIAYDFNAQSYGSLNVIQGSGGSLSFVTGHVGGSGGPTNNTYALKVAGPTTGFDLGFTLGPFTGFNGNILYYQLAQKNNAKMRVQWRTTAALWTTFANCVTIDYDQGSPFVKFYSGTNNLGTDALDHDQWIDHRVYGNTSSDVPGAGSISLFHNFTATAGLLTPKTRTWNQGSLPWNTSTAHHNNFSSGDVYICFSFDLATSNDYCVLDELAWTDDGVLFRPPTSLSAVAASGTLVNTSWTDPT